MSDEESNLRFYNQYTPPRSKEWEDATLRDVDNLRQEIFYQERTIALLPLLSSPSYPVGVIPPRNEILRYIMSPQILQSQDITPAFIQHASLFVNFLHNKPDLFASVVVQRYGQQDFHFTVFSVVPALYGFFSTYEHIRLSAIFYQNVIKIAPPQVAIVILQPLFCSLCTFRFVEAVMQPFTLKFGAEKRIDDPKRQKQYLESFALELITLIKQNAHHLPSVILTLFHEMVNLNWSLATLIDLFFNHFFNHQSIAWIASTPYSYRTTLFQKVLDLATGKQNVKLVRDALRQFVNVSSSFDIPYAYRAFDQSFVQILITVADIMCAARCFATSNELPFSLKNGNYDQFNLNTRYLPFWIRVFPKGQSGIAYPTSRLIFPTQQKIELEPNPLFDRLFRTLQAENPGSCVYDLPEARKTPELSKYCLQASINQGIVRADAFEHMLQFTLYKNVLDKWLDLSNSRALALMTPMAVKSATTAIKSDPANVQRSFSRCSRNFKAVQLKRLQFYVVMMPTLTSVIEPSKALFDRLSRRWKEFIREKQLNFDARIVNSLKPKSQYIFWETVEELRCVAGVSMNRQFDLLLTTIHKLKLIDNNNDEIEMTAIVLGDSDRLPVLFALFDEYIVGNQAYRRMMKDESYEEWRSFGELLWRFMLDSKAGDSYRALRDQIAIASSSIQWGPPMDDDSGSSSSWFFNSRFSDIKLSSSE